MSGTSMISESIDREQSKNTGNEVTYEVDKMTFVVTPVYRDGTGRTIHDILLNLMEKDSETP